MLKKPEVFENFQKILKYQISRNCVQWEPSRSMRTDRRTDMTNLIVAFRNFANAPKNFRATLYESTLYITKKIHFKLLLIHIVSYCENTL